MEAGRRILICAFAALSIAGPVRAAPARAIDDSVVNLTIAHPVSVTKLADLDFGAFSVTSAGTAALDPSSGSVSVTGGVNKAGGLPRAARFRITATRLALVFIRIPAAPVLLTRIGGSETMALSNWTMDGTSLRLMGGAAPVDFAVGGTLVISNGQAEGIYAGSFDVTVDYF